jgi:hypothetical protein
MTIIQNTPEYMRPVLFFPSIAKKIGVDSAILFQLINQRIHDAMVFLKDKTQSADFYKVQDDKVWVQFSYSEFEKSMPWVCERTIKRIVKTLKQKRILLLERQTDYFGGNLANWYSVNHEEL